MIPPIDLTSAETGLFEGTEAHATLSTFAGLWSGSTQLWLDPSAPPEETTTTLRAELVLGGRWLRATYQGVALAKPHAGEMLIGFHKEAREHELAWIDSFHTGSAIMLSKGKLVRPGVIDVLGNYLAGEQRWGWRTVLHSPSPGELSIESFNISPHDGEERAIVSRLTRV